MSNSTQVATAGQDDFHKSRLTDDQIAAFWTSILANNDVACGMARRWIRKDSVQDVVNTAAVKFIEALKRRKRPRKFPETDEQFRRQFLKIVRNHALDSSKRKKKVELPVHSHWGEEPEPVVEGRKSGDRSLDQVFSRLDTGEYDAPAPEELRDKDRSDELDQIIRCHLPDLSRMQRQVIDETFLQRRKRAEVASRLGISVYTYDNHLQAAFRALRHLLSKDADTFTEVDRSRWYDLIEELRERYEESRSRLSVRRTREPSNPERAPSNPGRDASKPERDASAPGRDRDKPARSDAA